MNENDPRWRQRFFLFTFVRLFGLAVFLAGVFIALTDILRPGGWPLVGGILAIIGAIDALLAPRMLRRAWEQQDKAQ